MLNNPAGFEHGALSDPAVGSAPSTSRCSNYPEFPTHSPSMSWILYNDETSVRLRSLPVCFWDLPLFDSRA